MSDCSHSTCETPFCPQCGAEIASSYSTLLSFLRKRHGTQARYLERVRRDFEKQKSAYFQRLVKKSERNLEITEGWIAMILTKAANE